MSSIELFSALLEHVLETVDQDNDLAATLAQTIFKFCQALPQWKQLDAEQLCKIADAYLLPDKTLHFLDAIDMNAVTLNPYEQIDLVKEFSSSFPGPVTLEEEELWIEDCDLLDEDETVDPVTTEEEKSSTPISVTAMVGLAWRGSRSPLSSVLIHVAVLLVFMIVTRPKPAPEEQDIVVTLTGMLDEGKAELMPETPADNSIMEDTSERMQSEDLMPEEQVVEEYNKDEWNDTADNWQPEEAASDMAEVLDNQNSMLSGKLDFNPVDLSAIGLGESTGPSGKTFEGDLFKGRGQKRGYLSRKYGGTAASAAGADAALDWLARHQHESGAWSWVSYSSECEGGSQGTCGFHGQKPYNPNATASLHDIAVTSLAIMAFLAGGHTDQEGQFQSTVENGLAFLIEKQNAGIYSNNMYAQAIATTAMAEAYGMTKNKAYRKSAKLGLGSILFSQHVDGGWRYDVHPYDSTSEKKRGKPSQVSDMSITGWVAVALKVSDEIGLLHPEEKRAIFKDLAKYVKSCQKGEYHMAGYTAQGGQSTRMTAVALVSNLLVNTKKSVRYARMQSTAVATGIQYPTAKERDKREEIIKLMQRYRKVASMLHDSTSLPFGEEEVEEHEDDERGTAGNPRDKEKQSTLERLKEKIDTLRAEFTMNANNQISMDLYYTYYGQLGLFMLQNKRWKKWNRSILLQTLPFQSIEGCSRGSWSKDKMYGSSPVFATAVTALMLQVYYRYPTLD